MRTTDTTTTNDQDLVAAAGRGDQPAFEELHRRHAPLAYRLALAVTGRPEDAATAVAEGTGATFTAVRAGRFQASGHGVALATASRNAALDLRRGQDAVAAPVAADDADPFLVSAFAALPERWRSVLWLRDAEGLDAEAVATIVELTPEAVDQLAVRARRGLRERYLKGQAAASTDRGCTRAIARLGALADGTLNGSDQATLERHLAGCEACTARRVGIAAIPTALAALAADAPADLDARSRAAFTAALATTSSTGLSPRTEKILAGASAFAAAVGVLGATLFGAGGGEDPVASPLAPLVADIDAPRPIDLSALTLPITTPDPVTTTARRSLSPVARAGALGSGSGATTGGGELAAPAPTSGSTAPTTPAAETPSTAPLDDAPIDVNVGEDTSVTVGPVTADLTPEPDEDPITIDEPEELSPVVEPIEETVNTVVEPVTEAVAPVLEAAEPVLEATEPVTSGVGQALGGLGR
ncbi:zf-HC2 domain-containing protein [Salinilacustrithrix flava]|uniref:zf-HC2 domain-containing protein n=1 Tax=Salinilacustrithrix flava TaxID=2957203 RepID=UPI003D7C15E8